MTSPDVEVTKLTAVDPLKMSRRCRPAATVLPNLRSTPTPTPTPTPTLRWDGDNAVTTPVTSSDQITTRTSDPRPQPTMGRDRRTGAAGPDGSASVPVLEASS